MDKSNLIAKANQHIADVERLADTSKYDEGMSRYLELKIKLSNAYISMAAIMELSEIVAAIRSR